MIRSMMISRVGEDGVSEQSIPPEEKRSDERIEIFKFKAPAVDGLPVWRFDDQGQDVIMSIITDMNKTGAAIILLRSAEISSQNLQMKMLPDKFIDAEAMLVDAQIRWQKDDYSENYKKVGVQFIGLTRKQQRYIHRMVKSIVRDSRSYLRCELRPDDDDAN